MMATSLSVPTAEELIRNVKQEAARRRASVPAPIMPQPPPAPVADWSAFDEKLAIAGQHAFVGMQVPAMRRHPFPIRWAARAVGKVVVVFAKFITVHQRVFNCAVVGVLELINQTLRRLDAASTQTNATIADLTRATQTQRAELDRLDQAFHDWSEAQDEQFLEFHEAVGRLEETYQHRLEECLSTRLAAVESSLRDQVQRSQQQGDDAAERFGQLEALIAGFAPVRDSCAELGRQLTQAQQRLAVLGASNSVKTEQIAERLEQTRNQLADALQAAQRQTEDLKRNLLNQDIRISVLLEETRKSARAAAKPEVETLSEDEKHFLDSLYVAFEDRFRGTREDIKNRFRIYLPVLADAKVGAEAPILDLGCGRGEWLELLRESGYSARGIDTNRVLVGQCRERQLDVSKQDLLQHLRQLETNSLGAVTAFHVIEHLDFAGFIRMLDEVARVLRPGGIAIFETPNPNNLQTGARNFYMDPTHRNPMPCDMVKFMVEARGLCNVEVLPLHPYPDAWKVRGGDLADRFNEFFYGPQDYAVVGRKV